MLGTSFLSPNGYAHQIGSVLQKNRKGKEYINRVIYSKGNNKFKFNRNLKELANHATAINMQHIATNRSMFSKICYFLERGQSLNTYEFRGHNGSLSLDTWKKNIYLDAALSKVAYEMAYEPDKNQKELSSLFEKDVTEDEKAKRLLNVLFRDEKDKEIFMSRWESNKDAPIFKKAKGFGNTFTKSDLKETAGLPKTKQVMNTMQKVFGQAKEFLRDESSYIMPEAFVMDYGGRDE